MKKIQPPAISGRPSRAPNRMRRNGESAWYTSVWFDVEQSLKYVYALPTKACYLFTDNEYERYIDKPVSIASTGIFPMGVLFGFKLGRRMSVLVKVSTSEWDKVVRIPMGVLKNALERGKRNPEDQQRPGILRRGVKILMRAVNK